MREDEMLVTSMKGGVDLPYAALALEAAKEGARAIDEHAEEFLQSVASKGARYDLVTRADREAERAIISHLSDRSPSDGILAEETGTREGTSGLRWVIDPIDGTTNFVHGRRDFAVSVGLESRDGIFAGAVVRPAHGDWAAAQGDVIYSSLERPMAVSSVKVNEALVAVGLCHDATARVFTLQQIVPALVSHVQDWRWVGSAACDLFSIADGSLDGYVGINLSIWDIAAGIALVKAAGGHCETIRAGEVDAFLAGSPEVVTGLKHALAAL
ncbi:inositol monophosphatase family protein [Streptomyces platensis]|uniref:inositol monophosphatase family protein n=1 Tax=Streptomyces platensis TaxID=58346 RepID=UPI001F428F3D|nr:inositol monophosphatase family protein [Streptomyces platensis]MCF3144284.1 inositol monophosphatase [Streptomyces platensis]